MSTYPSVERGAHYGYRLTIEREYVENYLDANADHMFDMSSNYDCPMGEIVHGINSHYSWDIRRGTMRADNGETTPIYGPAWVAEFVEKLYSRSSQGQRRISGRTARKVLDRVAN